ncbi:helix-turn-helix domain-containing protein [Scopulibacillus cellulosilyticus]|uniref:Helix-turn-helix domain-containing protein n=1 Tax=Scopulibacillus cellulosilyticus TaxID=2665665 RepID=A0ABW2Q5L0_9BACL
METEQWGRRIRAFRKLKGYTQADLAKELNISLSILGEIERGNRLPADELIKKISDTLGVSIDEFMEIRD